MSEFNLFVYGTLRGGPAVGGAAGRLSDCVKLGEGTIGGTLYDVDGRFPALVHYGSDPVQGEVWRCPAELLLELDAYEGTASGLFRRIATEIELASGESVPCWVYTAGPALSRQLTPEHRVASGSWRPRAT